MFKNAKASCKTLNNITDDQRNNILLAVADAIVANSTTLLEENAKDLAKMDRSNPLYDRLQLTEKRLEDTYSSTRKIDSSPLCSICYLRLGINVHDSYCNPLLMPNPQTLVYSLLQ